MEKFKIGDVVTITSGTYMGRKAKVEAVRKLLKEVDENENFVPDGFCTFESHIKLIQLPHTYDGNVLKVQFSEKNFGNYTRKAFVMTSKFYSYCYDLRLLNPTSSFLVDLLEDCLTQQP